MSLSTHTVPCLELVRYRHAPMLIPHASPTTEPTLHLDRATETEETLSTAHDKLKLTTCPKNLVALRKEHGEVEYCTWILDSGWV